MSAYTVFCDCAGTEVPIATITDQRAHGGALSVRGVGMDDTAHLFAVADGDRHAELYRQAAHTWAEYAVTVTTWGDEHETWSIRCTRCKKQAQMRDVQVCNLIDRLLAVPDALPAMRLPIAVLIRAVSGEIL